MAVAHEAYELKAEFTGKDPLVELNPVFTKVTIFPEEGNFPAIARALLQAADHPYQVRYVSHPKAGFEVPVDVFDRFQALMDNPELDHQVDLPAQTQPRKRRPGRPRKNAEEA